ncbi:uncharacterized protein RAG0_09334 [Rhynchosporium agropyri]|uniref:Uncharacterized protein n=1 Tax=Rhynchosporium agropyri TaxID=914238 RepID=A0A1E1KV58_9HELO|nr:uncharacterized protein RAG0_09334 [Rhynchosporium agropyri]
MTPNPKAKIVRYHMKEGINHPPPSPTPAHPRKKNQSIPSSDSTQKLNKESPENLPQAETLMVYDSVRSPDSFVAGNPVVPRSFLLGICYCSTTLVAMSKGPPAQTDVLMADRQPVTTVTYGIMNHNTHVPANMSCILTRDLSRRLGNQSELHPMPLRGNRSVRQITPSRGVGYIFVLHLSEYSEYDYQANTNLRCKSFKDALESTPIRLL